MKSKKNKIRTLGDHEKELRIRDKKLALEQKVNVIKITINPGKGRLKAILKQGKSYCSICKKTKSMNKFYVLYHPDGRLRKIWPSCKKCMSIKRKEKRTDASKSIIESCFVHYSKIDKIQCSNCKQSNFDSLTLVDLQYKNKEAVLSANRYKWLYTHKFPKIKLVLLCYNCAFQHINKYSKR